MTFSKETPDKDVPWSTHRSTPNKPADPLSELKPKFYKIGGKRIPFYGIGDLAKLLDREPDTLRKWEEKGWLPKNYPVYKGKDPEDPRSVKFGRRRLYTREHLIGILQIAKEEGILAKPNPRPMRETRFPARVKALFTKINEERFGLRPNKESHATG